MIKLKHYHHVLCFFLNNWFASLELAGAKLVYDFISELSGCGAKLDGTHLEQAKCLLPSGSLHIGDSCNGAVVVMVVWL